MGRQLPKCPKCNASMHLDHGVWHCFNDSEEIRDIPNKHQFFEQHKEEIIATYQAGGSRALKEKWDIQSSTWFWLRNRWKVPLLSRKSRAVAPAENGRFPELPPFSNDWPETVQLKWMDIWREIKLKEVK